MSVKATYHDIIESEQESKALAHKTTASMVLFKELRDFGREYTRAISQVREDLAALARQFGTTDANGNIQIDPERALEFIPLQADLMKQEIELNINGFKFEDIAPIAPALAWCIIDSGAESGEG